MESGWATGWKLTALPEKSWNLECSTLCCSRPAIGQIRAIPPVAASHSRTTSRLKDTILTFRLRGSVYRWEQAGTRAEENGKRAKIPPAPFAFLRLRLVGRQDIVINVRIQSSSTPVG